LFASIHLQLFFLLEISLFSTKKGGLKPPLLVEKVQSFGNLRKASQGIGFLSTGF